MNMLEAIYIQNRIDHRNNWNHENKHICGKYDHIILWEDDPNWENIKGW